MATFIERVLQLGDYETDGGAIDVGELHTRLVLYEAGMMPAADIKLLFNCTPAQELNLDAILVTMPVAFVTPSEILARARWASKLHETFKLGVWQIAPYNTEAGIRLALGVAG